MSPEISLSELNSQLTSSSPPLVAEILGPQYFARGHLPGALNLPLEGLAENAARLLPDKAARIVVYCSSNTCQNSEIAQRRLTSLGYQNVRVFKGGKAAWQEAGLSLVVVLGSGPQNLRVGPQEFTSWGGSCAPEGKES